jgi:hypothetical protein
MSVSYAKGHLIVVGFSKTIVALWSEKRVLSRNFESKYSGTPSFPSSHQKKRDFPKKAVIT